MLNKPRWGFFCHASSYKLLLQHSTVLSSCVQAWGHLFTSASLSSVRQHLVISVLNINTVVMCGSLFILSRRSVSLKLNRFCRSGDTSPGLSRNAVHLVRGLPGLCIPLWFEKGSLLIIGALLSAYLTSVFTDGVWHRGPCYWWGRGQGSSEVKLATGRGSGEREEWNTQKNGGGGGRLRPPLKRTLKLISLCFNLKLN